MSTVPLLLSLFLTTTSAPASSASASIPLAELLELQRRVEAAEAGRPPVAAVVTQGHLHGRLTSDLLMVDLRFEVEILADDRWCQLELLRLTPNVDVLELQGPSEAGVSVAAHEGALRLFGKKSGRHSVTAKVAVRSAALAASLSERRVELQLGRDSPAVPLQLDSSTGLFTLLSPSTASSAEMTRLFPEGRKLTVRWKPSTAASVVAKKAVQRPPVEPRIPVATASWVSTLEGRATVRVRYELRVDREQPLDVELPPQHTLERLSLNGSPVPVPVAEAGTDRKHTLKVGPSRLGESWGVLELTLVRELGVFHLSGALDFELPRVSWPVDEVRASTHFPAVFTYRRSGGSMEQYDGSAEAASQPVSVDSPAALPGKVQYFRQYLVAASAPNLELHYSVDISKSYFR